MELPFEIWLKISSYLTDIRHIISFESTCKHFNHVGKNGVINIKNEKIPSAFIYYSDIRVIDNNLFLKKNGYTRKKDIPIPPLKFYLNHPFIETTDYPLYFCDNKYKTHENGKSWLKDIFENLIHIKKVNLIHNSNTKECLHIDQVTKLLRKRNIVSTSVLSHQGSSLKDVRINLKTSNSKRSLEYTIYNGSIFTKVS